MFKADLMINLMTTDFSLTNQLKYRASIAFQNVNSIVDYLTAANFISFNLYFLFSYFQGQHSRDNNPVHEMKPLQERKTCAMNSSGAGESQQSSLEILATAAAQCSFKVSPEPRENIMKPTQDTGSENVAPSNLQHKLPSFATLAYNMVRNMHAKPMSANVRQEKRPVGSVRPGFKSTSLQYRLATDRGKIRSPKKSPKKKSAVYIQMHEKENISTPANDENRPGPLSHKFTCTDTSSTSSPAKKNSSFSEADKSRVGSEILKTKHSNENVTEKSTESKNSKKSPIKEPKEAVVKPKIWNPMFHSPKKQIATGEVKIKSEPIVCNVSGNTAISATVPVSQRTLIKHTVESMIKKKDVSVNSPKVYVADDVTIKRLLPKHEEEPSAKKIKLENTVSTPIPQTIPTLTEMKTPSKFPNIKQDFSLYNISMTPTSLSPYLPRGFEPSPKTYANAPLRHLVPPMQHCTFSPFSPSFGRADNILTPELYKSPVQVPRKSPTQSHLDTPLKSGAIPVPVLASPSMISPQIAPKTTLSDAVVGEDIKPSLPRVLAPKFAESENQPLSKEVSNRK